ncbi:MAG: methyltransferase domain-containing protein, partial [Euryarchaeota archaeon]|nr:methyltransferase domain-containing protein [Euryarchaeota archaeon]
VSRIRVALTGWGKDPMNVTVVYLAPFDKMLLRGIEATRELDKRAGINNGDNVLDIGSGLGGPARTFGAENGAEVIGVDLVPEFVETANVLAERTGVERHVRFQEANAVDLPFDDDTFDVVTSMAAFMNIKDKKKVYAEIQRVLKPNGRLAQLEVMQGPNGPPHFPVLWAAEPSYSFLETPDNIKAMLKEVGFTETAWVDENKPALEWAQNMARMMQQQGPPPVGPHIIIGKDAGLRVANSTKSLAEGRVTTAMIVMTATGQVTSGQKTERVAKQ